MREYRGSSVVPEQPNSNPKSTIWPVRCQHMHAYLMARQRSAYEFVLDVSPAVGIRMRKEPQTFDTKIAERGEPIKIQSFTKQLKSPTRPPLLAQDARATVVAVRVFRSLTPLCLTSRSTHGTGGTDRSHRMTG